MKTTISHPVPVIKNDRRFARIAARDASADGQFYFSVKTTGVYCRPSCASRPAKPENVQFHATWEEAERAGFRPCKRCQPNRLSPAAENAARIAEACRFIESAEETPKLGELARLAGMSAFHFHRTFKVITGVTPAGYATAQRAKRVRGKLARSRTVTEAIYDAGFGSNSRFYEKSNKVLGMTPSAFRAAGAETDIHFAIGACSLGSILVATSDRGVCAILLGDDPELLVRDLQRQFSRANLIGNERGYERLIARIVELVENPGVGVDLPLDIRGTAFQQRVWQALQQIPAGTRATYTEIAKKIGRPGAVRAVARACGANTLAVAIPCHRVVRTDGSLSGYRWGVERKQWLIDKERGDSVC